MHHQLTIPSALPLFAIESVEAEDLEFLQRKVTTDGLLHRFVSTIDSNDSVEAEEVTWAGVLTLGFIHSSCSTYPGQRTDGRCRLDQEPCQGYDSSNGSDRK